MACIGVPAQEYGDVGRAAHAGGMPHRGVNAPRETFRDENTIRVHPIITHGGSQVNVIPAGVRRETFVRGKTLEAIADADRTVLDAPVEAGGRRGAVAGRVAAGAIGARTLSNVRRYAERQQWPLPRVEVRLEGALDEARLAALREAALGCRISRALAVPVALRLTSA